MFSRARGARSWVVYGYDQHGGGCARRVPPDAALSRRGEGPGGLTGPSAIRVFSAPPAPAIVGGDPAENPALGRSSSVG